ncbi:alpha/beta hydrolase [Leptospira ognonensis]|uniref:Alpha/beta hydrolase n=1 Tax=Leptospira ognonensis TaxID=2484945 RepID=A0A4V3JSB2_9LEPT|nr:patatin-like phospholipase family protein [Leptospira ognonensis]TGL63940.1 alpha/beta hydrolase [Leptospira ognonensis]
MTSHRNRNALLSQYITVKDLFKNLPHAVIREMMDCTVREYLPSGSVLFSEGDLGMDLYILAQGRLRYEKTSPDGKTDLGEFQKLDILGELSLFTGEPRSATVVAIRDSEIIRVPRDLALNILTNHPQALLQVTRIIAERLARARNRDQNQRVNSSSFCFIPTSPDMNLDELIQAVELSAGQFGNYKIITSKDFYDQFPNLGEDTDLEHNILDWFQKLENNHQNIFYVGTYEEAACSKRFVRQSDRVILVQDSSLPPNKSPMEAYLDKTRQKNRNIDLLLYHAKFDSLPKNTSAHLRTRSVSRHYHVHIPTKQTIDRLLRGILGKSIGLALGGGGAKGFAHLGILRSIEESRVPIDMVSGTSAGSIFAALISMGYDSERSKIQAKKLWVDRDLLNEYTIPVLSLVAGKKYTEAIRDFFGEIQIEDLWIPYYAVSTDLSNSESHIHSDGSLWKAIRASTSLPGIVPPFIEEGVVFVDGGVMDNVPGLLLKEKGAGPVISVDVFGDIYPDQDKELTNYFDKSSPGVLDHPIVQLTNLINFKNIFQPKFPPIGDIIIRSILVSSRERIRQTEKVSELFLQIPTNNFGVLEWFSYEKLIELGYICSKSKIQNFKKEYFRDI